MKNSIPAVKIFLLLPSALLLLLSCRKEPSIWKGPELTESRDRLTVEQLMNQPSFPLTDMSFFARPQWAEPALQPFSGSITFDETEMIFPIHRDFYPGENIFPGIRLGFISHEEELIPLPQETAYKPLSPGDAWKVIPGTGRIWHEEGDGEWSRASFPLSLTDSYIGQVRNCVATFVYKPDMISQVCVQCSQETADLNDGQVGNMRVMLPAVYEPRTYPDSLPVIESRKRIKSGRLPVYPLSDIDREHELAAYFEKLLYTNAPTSLGAILMDEKIYLQPPRTRHGLYPYPAEMRHAVYSVSKSLTGALALFSLARLYGDGIFDALVSEYVPALAGHPGWQGVTFLHCLNMVTGTEGSEEAGHLFEVLVRARSAEEAIQNIAGLGDYPGLPGEKFNYASTNLFVLSYALQKYVESREGAGIMYWDMVHENVLIPIGAEDFDLLRTVEEDGSEGIPILAYGAWPTLDNAARIALLFSEEGNFRGQQLLHGEKCREALGRIPWTGYSTGDDYRGKNYRHSFWADDIKVKQCKVELSYMLGYGGSYIWFFPSGIIAMRFMDEYDLDFKELVKAVEKIRSSCN